MRRHILFAPALALALTLALVGCGGDDDDDASDTTTTEAESTTTEGDDPGSTTEGEETTTTEAGGTDGSTEPTETTTTEGGSTPSGDDDFCTAYGALENADDTAGFPEDPQTPQDYIDGFQLVLPYAEDALAVAPDEVRDDMALLVDAIDQLVDDLGNVGTLDEADALLQQVFSDSELEAAGDRVDDYYEQTCEGTDVESGSGAPATVDEE